MTVSINATDLNTPDALSTTTPKTDPILQTGQGIIDNALASIPSLQSTVDKNQTNTSDAVSRIGELMSGLLPKTADTSSLNESLGVNTEQKNLDKYNQDLNDINANVSGLAAEAKAIPLKIQQQFANTGATDAGVAPIQAGQLRENAIKALTQSALADITSANIKNSEIRYNSAKDKVQQAIDLKYKPMEMEIDQLKEQLALNKQYITDPAEKKLADAQEKAIAERTRLLTEKKNNEKDISSIALEAAKNGAGAATVSAISNSKDVNEAIQKSGNSLRETTMQKLDNGTIVVVDKQGHVLKTIGGGTGGGGTSLPTTVVNTVQTANGAKPVTGYALKAGDDPYNIAQQNGIDFSTLQKLNPSVTDWHNLPVGAVLNLPNTADAWLTGKSQAQVQAYNSLPDADKAAVKQLVTGDALLTDIVKSRGKQTQAQITDLINKATKIDPNFSINANKQRYQYQTQYNNPNGKEQLQIAAINTGLGHLAEFKTAADALNNIGFTPGNNITNFIKKKSGDPAVTNFNTVVTALAGELAAVYKGGNAPTDQETEQWRQNILASFSKQQSAGVANTTSNLISNKLQSLAVSYKNVMGQYPDTPIVNADALTSLQNAGVDTSSITTKLKAQGYDVPDAASNPTSTGNYNGFTIPGYTPAAGSTLYGGFKLPN